MTHNEVIRLATNDDVDMMADLLAILFGQATNFKPVRELQIAGLRAILAEPAVGTLLVIECNGEVVGMVTLLYTISTALGGEVAILDDMVLHPDHRGGGAGSRLLTAAIDYAKNSGCLRITLLTDASNVDAQRFYRRAGFVRSEMFAMRLRL
jgi:GNAT superfamily N-acetyltransferase